MGKACGQTSGSGTGNTQSIIRAPGFLHCLTPASPECCCPPCRPPGTRRNGKGRRNVQWRAVSAEQQEGLEPQQDLPMAPLQGLPRLDRVGGRAEALAGGGTHIVGAAPLGKGFHPSPGVAGIPSASPACGRLGADRVDPAPGQCEGCRAFGSSGIFNPAASVLPPVPAATRTRRARPREATDEGCGGEGLSKCL